MSLAARHVVTWLLATLALTSTGADAQTIAPTIGIPDANVMRPTPGATALTGKERLGEKWKDEQRIDNCKVPPDKRGISPRSDSCAHVPSG